MYYICKYAHIYISAIKIKMKKHVAIVTNIAVFDHCKCCYCQFKAQRDEVYQVKVFGSYFIPSQPLYLQLQGQISFFQYECCIFFNILTTICFNSDKETNLFPVKELVTVFVLYM